MTEDHIIGHVCEPVKNYDLLSVIMVCLGDLNETDDDGILRLLDTIFSDIDPKEKICIMENDFDIPIEPAMEREVHNMGGYGDVVFARGVDKGRIESIETLMKKMNLSANEAMDLLEIPKADQQNYLDMLKPQCA